MGFDQTGDIAEIFEALALAAPGIAPGGDFSGQGVGQRRDAHQDAVDVGGDGAGREVAVKFFGAELDADLRSAREVDGPFVGFGLESGGDEQGLGAFHVGGGHDEVDIARHHGFLGPMVDGDAADGAPGDFGAFQGFDEAQHVVGAACRLPVIELPSSHGGNIADALWPANLFLGGFDARGDHRCQGFRLCQGYGGQARGQPAICGRREPRRGTFDRMNRIYRMERPGRAFCGAKWLGGRILPWLRTTRAFPGRS